MEKTFSQGIWQELCLEDVEVRGVLSKKGSSLLLELFFSPEMCVLQKKVFTWYD